MVPVEDASQLGSVDGRGGPGACQCALCFALQEVDAHAVREVCAKYFYDQCPALAGLGKSLRRPAFLSFSLGHSLGLPTPQPTVGAAS